MITYIVDSISNSEDLIDSRDVIARIEQLTEERDSWVLGAPDGSETPNPEGWARDNPDEAEELETLEKLAAEAEGYAADWQYGETLIRDSYFQQRIDWERDARELRMDYTAVDFAGVTYWVRS